MNYLGRTICVLFLLIQLLSFSSCKKDYICPAYQSYYLLDSAKREKYFSLFGEDSLPKEIVEVKKSKVGIMEETTYRKRNNQLQTLPMIIVYPEPPDSVQLKEDSLATMVEDGGQAALMK
jgi:hypothetical protein